MTLHFLQRFSFFWLLHGLIFCSIVLIFINCNFKPVKQAAPCYLEIYRCLKISSKWLINRKLFLIAYMKEFDEGTLWSDFRNIKILRNKILKFVPQSLVNITSIEDMQWRFICRVAKRTKW